MNNQRTFNDYETSLHFAVEAIKKEKAKEKPDKKQLLRLARRLIEIEEHACDFTGGYNDEPIRQKRVGWRNPQFGKWSEE